MLKSKRLETKLSRNIFRLILIIFYFFFGSDFCAWICHSVDSWPMIFEVCFYFLILFRPKIVRLKWMRGRHSTVVVFHRAVFGSFEIFDFRLSALLFLFCCCKFSETGVLNIFILFFSFVFFFFNILFNIYFGFSLIIWKVACFLRRQRMQTQINIEYELVVMFNQNVHFIRLSTFFRFLFIFCIASLIIVLF